MRVAIVLTALAALQPVMSIAVPSNPSPGIDNTTLIVQARGDELGPDNWDRCPKNQHSEQKPNDKPEKPNGCGTKNWEHFIPGGDRFKKCCIAHDLCFGDCKVQNMHHCAAAMEQCMKNKCDDSRWFSQPKCEAEEAIYKIAINGAKALKIWRNKVKDHCVCKPGAPKKTTVSDAVAHYPVSMWELGLEG